MKIKSFTSQMQPRNFVGLTSVLEVGSRYAAQHFTVTRYWSDQYGDKHSKRPVVFKGAGGVCTQWMDDATFDAIKNLRGFRPDEALERTNHELKRAAEARK